MKKPLTRARNQREHNALDRMMIVDQLAKLRDAKCEELVKHQALEGHFRALLDKTESELERQILGKIKDLGFKLPNEAQKLISDKGEPIAQADFFYNPNVIVFVDGPDHDKDYVKADDEKKRKRLKGLGYKIRVIRKVDDVSEDLSEF